VAPFAWGLGSERIDADRFVQVAARVMPRRGIEPSPDREASLRAMHRRLA